MFEATGQTVRFTDGADLVPRSREIFHSIQHQTWDDRFIDFYLDFDNLSKQK